MLTGCVTAILATLQVELVIFIALNSNLMVACMKNLDPGTHDWKLLLSIIGVAIIHCSLPLALDVMGPGKHHFWFVDASQNIKLHSNENLVKDVSPIC